MKLILLGAPGAGKGTQAELISKALNIPSISTGNMLRSAIKNETPVGLQAKAFMDKGNLVPDDVIIGIVKERLSAPDCANGYILDGMPRTLAQAQALEDAGIDIDAALLLDIEDSVIEARMTGRRVCPDCGATFHISANPPKEDGVCDACGAKLIIRADDAPETVKSRLAVYHNETEPLVDFYAKREKLRKVDAALPFNEVTDAIFRVLEITK